MTVECFDAEADAVRSPEEIHRAILAAVEPLVFARTSSSVVLLLSIGRRLLGERTCHSLNLSAISKS